MLATMAQAGAWAHGSAQLDLDVSGGEHVQQMVYGDRWACPPSQPEHHPLPAMPPPGQPAPQPGQDKLPSSSIPSTRPASLPTVSTGAPLHPHAALPEASPKDHGEGRPETDTLTVSSSTPARNQNPTIPSTLNYNDAGPLPIK